MPSAGQRGTCTWGGSVAPGMAALRQETLGEQLRQAGATHTLRLETDRFLQDLHAPAWPRQQSGRSRVVVPEDVRAALERKGGTILLPGEATVPRRGGTAERQAQVSALVAAAFPPTVSRLTVTQLRGEAGFAALRATLRRRAAVRAVLHSEAVPVGDRVQLAAKTHWGVNRTMLSSMAVVLIVPRRTLAPPDTEPGQYGAAATVFLLLQDVAEDTRSIRNLRLVPAHRLRLETPDDSALIPADRPPAPGPRPPVPREAPEPLTAVTVPELYVLLSRVVGLLGTLALRGHLHPVGGLELRVSLAEKSVRLEDLAGLCTTRVDMEGPFDPCAGRLPAPPPPHELVGWLLDPTSLAQHRDHAAALSASLWALGVVGMRVAVGHTADLDTTTLAAAGDLQGTATLAARVLGGHAWLLAPPLADRQPGHARLVRLLNTLLSARPVDRLQALGPDWMAEASAPVLQAPAAASAGAGAGGLR